MLSDSISFEQKLSNFIEQIHKNRRLICVIYDKGKHKTCLHVLKSCEEFIC